MAEKKYDTRVFTNSNLGEESSSNQPVDITSAPAATKTSASGEQVETSVRAENTIVTQEEDLLEVSSYCNINEVELEKSSTTEKSHSFETILNRWVPVDVLEFNTTHKQGDIIMQMKVPLSLLSKDACTPNVLPFEQFIYGKMDIDMLFKINGNKFQAGKILISVLPGTPGLYDGEGAYYSFQSALQRPNIILDVSSNNEAILPLNWIYHRTFIRLHEQSHQNVGVAAGEYMRVIVHCLSKLAVTTDQLSNVFITPFFRITRAKFAGMSYKAVAKAQMMAGVASVGTFLEGIKLAEKSLRMVGDVGNRDKPSDLVGVMRYVPSPRMNFSHSRGLSDAIPLRMDPTALTTFTQDHKLMVKYTTLRQIMRIWGYAGTFQWLSSSKQGEVLQEIRLDPTNFSSFNLTNNVQEQQFTPLEYVMSLYQFWRGTMEVRLDFVSTSFHTGSVMISAEFGRKSASMNMCESASTYTKTFDLAEQKTVQFTIPYIYDTVWRRSNNIPILGTDKPDVTTWANRSGVLFQNFGRLKIRVVNQLRPISTVVQDISVLVFVRAGKDFEAHSLIQNNCIINSRCNVKLDDFPVNDYPTSYTLSGTTKTWVTGKVAKPQMNTEYLDTDKTHDFLPSQVRRIQHSEYMMNIKDVLRRPLLAMTQVKVNSYSMTDVPSAFFFPTQPITLSMLGGTSCVFSPACKTSAHVAITSLFRFWRGSLRYTLVFYQSSSNVGSIVYVSYLPHSGVRIIGNRKYPFAVDDNPDKAAAKEQVMEKYEPGSAGIQTEMIVPGINPTCTIEVPYYTETNWTWLNNGNKADGGNAKDMPWRDKGDENTGHIMIRTNKATDMDVWISVGDDFEIAGYLGTVSGKRYNAAISKSDDHPRGQILEKFGLDRKQLVEGVRILAKPLGIAAVNYYSPSLVLPAVAVSYGGSLLDFSSSVTKLTKDLGEITDGGKVATMTLNTSLAKSGTILEVVEDTLEKILKPVVGLDFSNIKSVLMDLLLDFYSCWTTWSPKSVAITICKILLKMKIVGISSVALLTEALKKLVACFPFGPKAQNQDDDWKSVLANFMGLAVAAIGAIMGVKSSIKAPTSLIKGLFIGFTSASTWSIVTHATRFFKDVMSVFQRATMWLLGLESPEARGLSIMSANSVFLKAFIEDAQNFLKEANQPLLRTRSEFKTKFWITVCNAYIILAKLAESSNNKVSPVLVSLCKSVIRKSNDLHMVISSSPVRYEPFVICLEGAPGIGKSKIAKDIAYNSLRALKYESDGGELLFYRTPGTEFWNSYKSQPVIIFDDFMNIRSTEKIDANVTDLYNLKSAAIFNPPMAKLEEKELRANPLTVILLMNDAFAEKGNVSCAEALTRRRDIIIKARKVEKYAQMPTRKIPIDVLSKFDHLEFCTYADANNSKSLNEKWVPYSGLKDYLAARQVIYHVREQISIQNDIKELHSFFSKGAQKYANIGDPFTLLHSGLAHIYKLKSDPEALPSDQITFFAKQLAEKMQVEIEQQESNQVAPIIPEEPEDPCVIKPNMLSFFKSANETRDVSFAKSSYVNARIASAVQGFFDSFMLRSKDKRNKCSICLDEKFVFANCSTSSLHPVCCSCYYMQITYSARQSVCAVCRTGEYVKENGITWEEIKTSDANLSIFCKILRGIPGFVMGATTMYAFTAAKVLMNIVMMQIEAAPLMMLMGINFGKAQISLAYMIKRALWLSWGGANEIEMFVTACEQFHGMFAIPFLKSGLALSDYLFEKSELPISQGPSIRDMRDVPSTSTDIFQDCVEELPAETDSSFELVSVPLECEEWKSVIGQTHHNDFIAGKISEHTLAMIAAKKAIENPELIQVIRNEVALAGRLAKQVSIEKDPVGEFTRPIKPLNNITTGEILDFIEEEQAQEKSELDFYANYKPWFKNFGLPILTVNEERESKEKIISCKHSILVPELVSYLKESEQGSAWLQLAEDGETSIIVPNAVCKGNSMCYWRTFPHKRLSFYKQWVLAPCNKDKLLETISSEEYNIPEEFIVPVEEQRSYLQKLYDDFLERDWWSYLSDKFKQWKDMLTMLGYGLVGVVTVYTTYKGCKHMWNFFSEPTIESNAVYNTSVPLRATGRGVRFVKRDRPQSDSSLEASCKFLYRNMGHIVAKLDGKEMWCTFVGLGGRKALIMSHYLPILRKQVEEGSTFALRSLASPHLLIPWKFEESVIGKEIKPDITVITLPPQFPIFKNIVKFFAKKEDIDEASLDVDGMMLEPPSLFGDNIAVARPIEFEKYCLSKKIQQSLSEGERKYDIVDVLQYNYARDGACGALVMSPYLDRPILGIHVAGSGNGYRGTGYSVILTQEEINGIVSGVHDYDEMKLNDPEISRVSLGSDEGIVPLGSVLPNMATFVPHLTNIQPSVIQAELAPVYSEPCILSSHDARHIETNKTPLIAGVLKHGKLVDHLDSKILQEVEDYFKEYYKQFPIKRVGRSKLTVKEALCGFKNLEYYDPIDLTTSAGWPWTQIHPESIKSKEGWVSFIRDEQQYPIDVEISEQLEKKLDLNMEKRRKGILPFTVFTDLLKDERKLSSKVRKEGSTRVFCASPIDCTIATRQLFLDFCAMFMSHRFLTMSAVGIATDGPEWGKLHKFLTEYNSKVVCLDYKNFGPSFSAQAFEVAKNIILEYLGTLDYSEEDLLEARVLLEEHQNSNHICCDFVYKQLCGSPSGSALTVIINSLVNVVYMSYSWIKITNRSMADFVKNVRLVTYGDDLLMAVKDTYLEQFNGSTIHDLLFQYRIETSDDRKEECVAPYRDIGEATFLKCKFVPHPSRNGEFLSELEWTSVEEAAKWIHKRDNAVEATLQNAEASVRMAFGHGREKFNKWRAKVNKALKKRHIHKAITVTWDECDRNFFDNPIGHGEYIF